MESNIMDILLNEVSNSALFARFGLDVILLCVGIIALIKICRDDPDNGVCDIICICLSVLFVGFWAYSVYASSCKSDLVIAYGIDDKLKEIKESEDVPEDDILEEVCAYLDTERDRFHIKDYSEQDGKFRVTFFSGLKDYEFAIDSEDNVESQSDTEANKVEVDKH